jgi:hypothetical protein
MVNCYRTKQGLEIESWGFLIDTDPPKMDSDILFVESNCLSSYGKLLKTDSLKKNWLTAHFAELTIDETEPNCCIVQRNGGDTGCLQFGE